MKGWMSVSKKRQEDLPWLATRLDGIGAKRLYWCAFSPDIIVVAIPLLLLVFEDSMTSVDVLR